ncbi:hypothetical protein VST7929_01454 [Vibrio stylophorae]|uniref:HTH marR-type domain-containing protein n=1 Tax=Vibrio stylophorae TaxID=659351 RepID=A0ABN8DTI5_9VIBR|nr:MarR family transcriptional regulator [Vibrio stylophorae]CAH0533584.1 hypothetical protein VST7929_01454 [Vibrio stylophorae]
MASTQPLESLFHLVHGIKRLQVQQLEKLNLPLTPMHLRVLKIIAKVPQCSALTIAQKLNRDKAQITRLVSTLISEGYLQKAAHPTDKRSQILNLTAQGESISQAIQHIEQQMQQQMLQGLNENELALFAQVTQKMVANLHPEIAPQGHCE